MPESRVGLAGAFVLGPGLGWGSPRIIGLLVISVLGLGGLVFSQRRTLMEPDRGGRAGPRRA